MMAADTKRMRGAPPFVRRSLKTKVGLYEDIAFIETKGPLAA